MFRLGEIARMVEGTLEGPEDIEITGAAPVDQAGPGDITFATEGRYLERAKSTGAAAVIVAADAPSLTKPVIRVKEPRLAWATVLEAFAPPVHHPPGVHEKAVLGEGVRLGKNVSIQAYAVVCDRAVIGDDVVLYPGVYIGEESVIGDGSILYPNVTVRDRVRIGKRVIVHPGSVIGSDGFGYVTVGRKHRKVPHIGTVVVEDDVEIGSLVTIDRGNSGATVIGRGTKIDNLVQIAHNVQVGEDCLIVAMTGIAGSSEIGDRVTLAGQSGVAGHLSIGDESVVAARGLVARDLPRGSFVSGAPARPHREAMKALAAMQRLPRMAETVQEMNRRLRELEEKLARLEEEIPAAGEPH